MARKKALDKEAAPAAAKLKPETVSAIYGVAFLVIAVILLLSAFGKAGVVGDATYRGLSTLFGIGYYALAILFAMLSVSAFRNLERKISGVQAGGATLLFFSILGMMTLAMDRGGIVGGFISRPIERLVDVYAAAVILSALIVISFLVTFDTSIRLGFLQALRERFIRKPDMPAEDAPVTVAATPEPAPAPTKQEEENDTEEAGLLARLTKKVAKRDEEEEFVPRERPVRSTLSTFTPPPLSLLEKDRGKPGVGDIKANANIIKRTLQNFGIPVEMDEVSIGPSITRYALKPAEGVKLSKILGLQNNLELALAAHPVRIEAPIPGKSLVGIEIPNMTKTTVGLGSLLSEPEFEHSDKPLLVSLGKGISGMSHFANIAKMPHALIAGATGSGKSVTIHAIIASLLFRSGPDTLKFIMIDPKRVELTLYNSIPHLLTPVITDAKKAILALKWAAKEMDRRYNVLENVSVRDIGSYHKNIVEPAIAKAKGTEGEELPESMPYIVIVIDELADIMQSYPRELEAAIVRLAQMSRAVGIHLILSTQRPSVNVITGLIKANVPTRIALQVASQIDSRTILDQAGAEKLLGAGDMLYMSGEMSKPVRLQSAFISETEVKRLVKHLADTNEAVPSELDFTGGDPGSNSIFSAGLEDSGGGDEDDLFEEAREEVIRSQKASTSYLQRKLGVGYARAARLMDMLEERGVVGPGSGSKPREVLIKPGGATDYDSPEA